MHIRPAVNIAGLSSFQMSGGRTHSLGSKSYIVLLCFDLRAVRRGTFLIIMPFAA